MNVLFLLKKLAGALLTPFQFSLALIVFGAALLWLDRGRHLAKSSVTLGIGLLLIFSNPFVSYHLVHDLEARYPPLQLAQSGQDRVSIARHLQIASETAVGIPISELGHAPFIVVLSGGAANDLELSETDRLTPSSAIRVAKAVQIYRCLVFSSALMVNGGQPVASVTANHAVEPQVIFLGGPTVGTIPEAIPMQKLAESLGIPPEHILVETQSNDTSSEAKNIFQLVGNRPFILVTSAFHMPRAVALFKHFGMRPIPAPADYVGQRNSEQVALKILPSITALDQSTLAWHERLGMLWEHLRGQL